jgi:ectoine hydroxylase-related dioxygenase (phytanoyl-CoA dioxygenase family)/quercetin dioxygenase-like cupin family protein
MASTQLGITVKAVASLGDARALHKEMYDQFAEQGYATPVRVLSARECQRFLQAVNDSRSRPPLDWEKGHAPISRAFYEISTHPAIIEVVAALLGEDIMLWGASIQNRPPDAVHPWHSDIESSAPAGKTVAVWIGIEHTTRDSSLLIIPYSHRFGVTVQEVRHTLGKGRDETTNEDIVRWARERERRSHLVRLEMTDGEALFFDGQLWHCSHNLLNETRQALLLQYATPDTMIRLPDLNYLDWPFHQLVLPKPACLMIRGSGKGGVNRIVPAPMAAGAEWGAQLTSQIYPLRIPLPPDKEKGWKPYPIFGGCTADLRHLSCHASVLTHGQSPHPPHRHKEEELLLLLAGEVDLLLPDEQAPTGDQRKRLRPGQFVYYPARFAHTLQAVSEDPANYMMLKWHTDASETDSPLHFGHFNIFDHTEDSGGEDRLSSRLVFEGPTAYLRKLHCHTSTLTPGSGYEPHIDAYDVAIVVLEGQVETLGERVGPHGVIFYPAGEPHGMRNPGETFARYVVFEFHGSQRALGDALPNPPSPFAKLTDPRRWKRKLKDLLRPIRNRARGLVGRRDR